MNATQELSKKRISRFKPGIILVVGILLLVFSWLVLFWLVEFDTDLLAPYDTTPLANRPPWGTWQRDLSDFFQDPPGSVIPALLIVGISIVLLVIALGRTPGSFNVRIRLLLSFALSNLVIVAAMFFSGFVVADLPLEIAPYPGYGWTLKFLVPDILLLALLFALQGWDIPKWLLTRFPTKTADNMA